MRVDLAGAGSRQSIPVDVRKGILSVIQMSSVKPENEIKSNTNKIPGCYKDWLVLQGEGCYYYRCIKSC